MALGESRRWFLLVEDNEDEERLAIRAFKRAVPEGDAVVARDGEEAQRMLSASTTNPPAFVVLDIRLPKINGLEVLRWMRTHHEFTAVPGIVMIGSAGMVDQDEIYRMGANSLLRKELEYDDYMAKMVPAFKYWWELNAVPVRIGNVPHIL
jgi:two-component system response regulator